MKYLYYTSIYLIIGTAFMLLLDFLHRMVRKDLPEEFQFGYQNWERIYIILTWPIFIYSVTKEIVKARKQK